MAFKGLFLWFEIEIDQDYGILSNSLPFRLYESAHIGGTKSFTICL